MDMQLHRHEDREMFSQCFCDLCDATMQVAEMLCQHLSLLDSEKKKWKRETERKRARGLMRRRSRRNKGMDTESLKGLMNSNRG